MASEKQNNIFQTEGQLAIDLLQNKEEFVIQAALAGVKGEDLDILVEGDSVIIKGVREKLKSKKNDYQYILQECYWGPFSREVILPEEIKIDDVEAIFKNLILTIRIPKLQRERRKKVLVKVKD
jgi:HSP20 family protein